MLKLGWVKEFKPMQSFIIASKNIDKGIERAKLISLEKSIHELDTTTENFEKSVGIEDVRNFTKKLFLKPFRGESKALIIKSSYGLTTESQNALLKILEEPPNNTFIFLVVRDINILLSTIISRCKIIKLEEETKAIDEKEVADFKKILENLVSENAGYKLKIAQDYGKSREEAIEWLEEAILSLRKILLSQVGSSVNLVGREADDLVGWDIGWDIRRISEVIEKLEEGRTAVKTTNVNQRFILENTFLSI